MTKNVRLSASDYFLRYRSEKKFNDKESVLECFNHFDRFKNSSIDIKDFGRLLKGLFCFNGNSYYITQRKVQLMFDFYKDHIIDKILYDGFEKFWFQVIKKTLFPRSALIIVDVQNDFIDGTLSLKKCPSRHDGSEVVPLINNLINEGHFNVLAYTLDWHPEDHCSFIENINMRKIENKSQVTESINVFDTVVFENNPTVKQKLWPSHCIQETRGAELHELLKINDPQTDKLKRKVFFAKKGQDSNVDSYSPFFNTNKQKETELDKQLKDEGVTDLYICGLAYDVCVASTALNALFLNYRVVIVEDACRGTDLNLIKKQRETLINRGAVIVNSIQVCDMVACRDRRPELAYSYFLLTALTHDMYDTLP